MDRENASDSRLAQRCQGLRPYKLLQRYLPDNGEPSELYGREPSVDKLRAVL